MSSEVMPNWLDKRAFLSPQKLALSFEGKEWTFKELQLNAKHFAALLHTWGVKRGDHVAILSNNRFEMVALLHALPYLEAVGVMLNTRLTEREMQFQLKDAECSYLIYEDSLYQSSFSEIVGLECKSYREIESLSSTEVSLCEEIEIHKPYTIMYTSGTTGSPKGVVHCYGNHWWSAISSVLNLGINEEDKWLAALPLFHVGGLSILMKSVIYGMPVHLHKSFDEESIHQAIMEEGVTTVSVVSVMLDRLLARLGESSYPSTFRCMLLGGGPAPKSLLERAKDKNVPVFQTYGMTETSSQIVTLSPQDALRKIGSAGKSLFPAQLNIMVEHRQAEPNEVGEIIVKGPMVTKGYFKRPESNEETIQNGWLSTGDLGYLDHEGFLYVVDRRKDLIISGGENVYPAEIEGVLSELSGVIEAGVIGKEDEQWGHVPVAFIVLEGNDEIAYEDIQSFCLEKLAKFKVPKEIYFVDHLPRNASKKILRRELTNWLKQRRNVE